jgi:hypothetical protein
MAAEEIGDALEVPEFLLLWQRLHVAVERLEHCTGGRSEAVRLSDRFRSKRRTGEHAPGNVRICCAFLQTATVEITAPGEEVADGFALAWEAGMGFEDVVHAFHPIADQGGGLETKATQKHQSPPRVASTFRLQAGRSQQVRQLENGLHPECRKAAELMRRVIKLRHR